MSVLCLFLFFLPLFSLSPPFPSPFPFPPFSLPSNFPPNFLPNDSPTSPTPSYVTDFCVSSLIFCFLTFEVDMIFMFLICFILKQHNLCYTVKSLKLNSRLHGDGRPFMRGVRAIVTTLSTEHPFPPHLQMQVESKVYYDLGRTIDNHNHHLKKKR